MTKLPYSAIASARVTNGIKKYRFAIGLSQSALAYHVGVSRQTISAIEKGRIMPSIKIALKLAAYLDTNVEALFSLNE